MEGSPQGHEYAWFVGGHPSKSPQQLLKELRALIAPNITIRLFKVGFKIWSNLITHISTWALSSGQTRLFRILDSGIGKNPKVHPLHTHTHTHTHQPQSHLCDFAQTLFFCSFYNLAFYFLASCSRIKTLTLHAVLQRGFTCSGLSDSTQSSFVLREWIKEVRSNRKADLT